jgi:hypothetical protein
MRKHEREQRRRGWRENGEPLDNKMISPLVAKVKRFYAPSERAWKAHGKRLLNSTRYLSHGLKSN